MQNLVSFVQRLPIHPPKDRLTLPTCPIPRLKQKKLADSQELYITKENDPEQD